MKETGADYGLSFEQKAKLALNIFLIYWPIRLYISLTNFNLQVFESHWKPWIVEISVTVLFFIFWLSITEWLRRKVFKAVNNEFVFDFDILTQLATFIVAGSLALVFNYAFHVIWWFADSTLNGQDSVVIRPEMAYNWKHHNHMMIMHDKAENGLTIMAMLSLFYLAANRRSTRKLELLRFQAEQLKRAATQAQFSALKNQINPHFLFNSLSVLSSLVEVDAELSVHFIDRLSKAYRYILEQRESERVPLRTELDFMNTYTFLLNIRFDGKLSVKTYVSESEAGNYQIAPLTLQLLVENAVKHNSMSAAQPLIIELRVIANYLVVSNGLQPRPAAEESTGIGIKNIIDRYALLTTMPVLFENTGQQFVVKIPLLT